VRAVAVVNWPKVLVLMVVTRPLRLVWFSVLKASARNCNRNRSVTKSVLARVASRFSRPGMRTALLLRLPGRTCSPLRLETGMGVKAARSRYWWIPDR